MPNILFLKIGAYFLPTELPTQGKYMCLSKHFSGDIFAVVNTADYKNYQIGNFSLIGLNLPKKIRHSFFRNIIYASFAIIMATYRHYFKSKYDAIITYDPLVTGFLGLIIGKLIGAKVIVEINGNYVSEATWGLEKKDLLRFLKYKYSKMIIPFIMRQAHGVKILYQDQIASFSKEIKDPLNIYCFHNLVPISYLKPQNVSKKYILFLGSPWYLKGIDILIKAFNKICRDFSEYTLKIVGYFPEKATLIELAGENRNIEICEPVWHEDAMRLLSECCLFVLPSRSEAMGRVLLEAMAFKKPIIASNVDGIPTYIKSGYNGLLFESENVDDLAEKLTMLLNDKKYADQLAENGYKHVHANLSEENYLENYNRMIEKVLTA